MATAPGTDARRPTWTTTATRTASRRAPGLAAVVAVTLLVALPGAARAASDVQVTLLDCESHPRRMAIQNKGDTPQNLAGWKLLSDKPNEVFDLGVAGQVAAGETFYVF